MGALMSYPHSGSSDGAGYSYQSTTGMLRAEHRPTALYRRGLRDVWRERTRRRLVKSLIVSAYVVTLPVSVPILVVVYRARGKPLMSLLRKIRKHQRIKHLNAYLWYGCEDQASRELKAILARAPRNSRDYAAAAAALASRWDFLCRSDEAMQLLKTVDVSRFTATERADLATLKAMLYPKTSGGAGAEGLARNDPELLEFPNFRIALANSMPTIDGKLDTLKPVFTSARLAAVESRAAPDGGPFDCLTAPSAQPADFDIGTVSVIFPVFNAAETVSAAIRSVLTQTYSNLEVVLVDDCSSDATYAVLSQIANQDSRIKLVQTPANSGAYAARNRGLDASSGAFVTTHDSDDWSHPQKIEAQLRPFLEGPKTVATGSYWVRATPEMNFQTWMLRSNLIHHSYPSFLVARHVFERLGAWDEVRVSGDAEFMYRVRRAYGARSVVWVHDDAPLAFALADETTLTGTKETHVSSTRLGLRYYYHQAFKYQWKVGLGLSADAQAQRERLIPRELTRRGAPGSAAPSYDLIVEADYRFRRAVRWTEDAIKGMTGPVGVSHRPEFSLGPETQFTLCKDFFELVDSGAVEIVNDPDNVESHARYRISLDDGPEW